MKARKTRTPSWHIAILLAAAFLVLAAAAGAEHRLPANRTYLISVQGLADDPFATEFSCIVFYPDGRLVAGEDVGQWSVADRLTVSAHQYAITFEIDVQNDDVRLEGLCWLEHRGPIHSLSCSAWGTDGELEANFALTGRPLAGETSAVALGRCQAKANAMNGVGGFN